jgi:hypothetical protein
MKVKDTSPTGGGTWVVYEWNYSAQRVAFFGVKSDFVVVGKQSEFSGKRPLGLLLELRAPADHGH